MAERRNIFLIGPMGAGKSTIGKQLANLLGMEFYDIDQEIERRTGADIAWVFDVEGEVGFRLREERVIAELVQQQGIVLATGGGAILSSETRKRLASRGVVIYLEPSVERQLIRTQRDKKRPLLRDAGSEARRVLEEIAKVRTPLYQEIADFTVRTDNQSPRIVTQHITSLLG